MNGLDRLNFSFRPSKKGFEKILGELETQVMEIVWRREEVSVREVYDELNQKRPLAYTTVLTTMKNLYTKKLLERRQSGIAFIYVPVYTRDELSRLAVDEIVNGLLNDFAQPFLACLTNLRHKDELADIVGQLEELLKEKDEGDSSQ